MRSRFSIPLLLLFLLISTTSLKAQTYAEKLNSLSQQAVSADQKIAAKAIAELRNMGSVGLEALFATHAAEINARVADPLKAATPEWERLTQALDSVSQQRNSYLSGLYWYTDLSDAKLASQRSGKPILSLRLLGKLSEEFSCANSRFFRTILYSNAAISRTLREDFILHWRSVRPAPRVTIDFGDGRKLERTLTGNSIHYILDSEGRLIEALPGLYGPQAFLRELLQSEKVFAKLRESKNPNPGVALYSYRQNQLRRLYVNWVTDIVRSGGKAPEQMVVMRRADGTIEAIQAAPLAMTKMATEATLLRSLTSNTEPLAKLTDEARWRKIAELHNADAKLDDRSIGLIRRETRKVIGNTDVSSLLKSLELNVALDTARNEYLMRTQIYAWLVQDRGRSGLDDFNNKVYAELFLTPASDPWLGLFTADTYMALDDAGVVR